MDYQIIKGKIPVIISAPHSKKHLRAGYSKRKPKPNEINTANIVKILCKKTNCWGIFSTKNLIKDPNWYKKSDYKEAIKKLVKEQKIKLLIDIHGAKKESDFLIECFSLLKDNQLKKLIKILKKNGFPQDLILQKPFKDYKQETIAEFSSKKLKINSVQLELNKKIRIKSSKYFKPLIRSLKEFIQNFD